MANNAGNLLVSASGPLWVDKQDRAQLWPGEGVLLSILIKNPKVEADVLLLNVMARVLSMLPHEILLRPTLTSANTPGHNYCYTFPGLKAVIERYVPLLGYYGESHAAGHQDAPLSPTLSAAYCPCGHLVHADYIAMQGKRGLKDVTDYRTDLTDVAMSGNLPYLNRSLDAAINHGRGRGRGAPMGRGRGRYSAASAPKQWFTEVVGYGFVIGGHEKNLGKFLPWEFRVIHPEALDLTTNPPPRMLRGAVSAQRWDFLRAWMKQTKDKPEHIILFLLLAGASPAFLKEAVKTKMPKCSSGDESEKTEERRRDWIRKYFEQRLMGDDMAVAFNPNEKEVKGRIALWEAALDLGVLSKWAFTTIAPQLRGMDYHFEDNDPTDHRKPMNKFFKQLEDEEYQGMTMFS